MIPQKTKEHERLDTWDTTGQVTTGTEDLKSERTSKKGVVYRHRLSELNKTGYLMIVHTKYVVYVVGIIVNLLSR